MKRTMKAMAGVALLGLAATGGTAMAATSSRVATPGPFFALRLIHDVREKVEALNITKAQKAEIKAVIRAHKAELRSAADKVFEARMAVADTIHQDGVDEALIRQRVQEAASAQADLAVLRAKVRAEARAVLTPAQREGAERIRKDVTGAVQQLRSAFQAFVDDVLG